MNAPPQEIDNIWVLKVRFGGKYWGGILEMAIKWKYFNKDLRNLIHNSISGIVAFKLGNPLIFIPNLCLHMSLVKRERVLFFYLRNLKAKKNTIDFLKNWKHLQRQEKNNGWIWTDSSNLRHRKSNIAFPIRYVSTFHFICFITPLSKTLFKNS